MNDDRRRLLLIFGLLTVNITGAEDTSFPISYGSAALNRGSFPAGFLFGTTSSSYQYEGAPNVDGRGPSMWDVYTHKYPEKIADGSNGDVADDSYHKYKEDVSIMKEMGLDAYRFSISWSRILPKGKLSGGVNKKGIEYYNSLINELLSHDIQPYVTLFHFDLPQALEDEYGGFLSPLIVDDFRDYVAICFEEFGDRVKHWITLNEPSCYSSQGYSVGNIAPGRCSEWQELNCTGGNSATEPYLVVHYQLLAHAAAVKLYKEKYQASQNGKIGITLLSHWFEPYSNTTSDRNAALRALDFMLGWSLDPIVYGDYPRSMRSLVGARLPKFSKEESTMLKGAFDFIGLNYYTAKYALDDTPQFKSQIESYVTDSLVNLTTERNGIPIGPPSATSWLFVYPKGIWNLVMYVKERYGNPLIYITENGVSEVNNSTLPLEQQLADPARIDYHSSHLGYLQRAIKEEGANIKGYFAWSLLDTFEWSGGYTIRFGINYVDFKEGLKRYPKSSALWFRTFLKKDSKSSRSYE